MTELAGEPVVTYVQVALNLPLLVYYQALGEALLNTWVLPFEIASVLLTAALVLSAWGFANLAALPFHRWVEAPSSRLRFNPLRWLVPQGSFGR